MNMMIELIPFRISEKENWYIQKLRATYSALIWKTDPQNWESGHTRPTLRLANAYYRG